MIHVFIPAMNKFWLVSIFLLLSGAVYSQKQEIKFESISVQQGLSDRSINCIIQDHLGFMWIGGSNGLYRYDGFDFLTYRNLPGCGDCPIIRNVYYLIEDRQGLLWILSDIGITLFDPVSEKSVFLYPLLFDLMQESVLDVPNLIMDQGGSIWAPFSNELVKISYKKETPKGLEPKELIFSEQVREAFHIENITLFPEEEETDNFVTGLYEDQQGNIFAGCREGIYVQQKESGTFIRLDKQQGHAESPVQYVTSIAQLEHNKYLITTNSNLMLMEGEDGKSLLDSARIPQVQFHIQERFKDISPISLLVDRQENCFLGTDNDLLRIHFHEEDQFTFESIGSKNQEPGNVSYTIGIKDIYEDRSGMIWIAQDYDGITKYNMNQGFFSSYKELVNENFESSDINPIEIDQAGDLWIGTYGGGLYQVMQDSRVRQYDMLDQKNKIICISEVKPGFYWIGGAEGVLEFDKSTGKSRNPLPDNKVGDELRSSMIWDIQKVQNFMLVASRNGLFVYDLETKQLSKYNLADEGAEGGGNNIISLCQRANGEILLSNATEGIFSLRIDPQNKRLEWISLIGNEKLLNQGIDLSRLHTLYEDKKGQVWLTSNPGICKLDFQNDTIQGYSLSGEHEFLEARSIIEDDQGYFWIGTQYGLYRFSSETGESRIFTEEDGLPISIHGLNSMCMKNDGRIVSGGIEGFYEFHPDSLRINLVPPQVVITAMQVFNEQLGSNKNEKVSLNRKISYAASIDLKYNQNDFAITFASLDYHKPVKNKYAYKLEGYQDDWLETDALNRQAIYIKLKPGKYTFRVKSSNGDQVWNEEGASLAIIIHNPWWTSTPAWISYAFLFIFLVWGFVRWRLWRLKKEKRELEFTVKHRTEEIETQKGEIQSQRDLLEHQNEKIRKEEWLRSRFFENVSHEFRTPLTLIQNPVEELLEEPKRKEKERRKLNMVLRNTRRLHDLVNQLLDISRLDASEMKLELQEGDVMEFLTSIGKSFISMAEVKSIFYQRQCAREISNYWFDSDKLEKIIVNLLSNAFKYTEEGGEVSFEARYLGMSGDTVPMRLEMVVKDSGVGIPAEDQDRIFDRFYQVEHKKTSEIQGTGIGLSLVLDLVSLMHGEINLRSESGNGSTFTVTLPLGKTHLKEAEYSIIEKAREPVVLEQFAPEEYKESVDHAEVTDEIRKNPLILIVEDNSDLRSQLRESLEDQYSIIEAVDGLAGGKKALEIIPDLILTDLMMPKMDGVELCEKIRSNETTSHIPIIMLTAKDTLDDKISGLQSGADDYISKPFHMAELSARIANLIQQREGLKARFGREITLEPSEITVTPLDEKLLSRAIHIVEEHLKDENFGLELFRQEMNLSRSSLSRKLHALTGQSPSEFIRIIRLKRAASLLAQNFGTITDVAFEVGFNNLSYFNRTFKKQFGKSPTTFIKGSLPQKE